MTLSRSDCFRFLVLAFSAAFSTAAQAQVSGAAVHCTVSASGLSFGRYTPGTPLSNDSTATLSLTCSSPAPMPMPVRLSIALEGAAAPRQLAGTGGHGLRYQLYVDAARSIPWGDGTGGTAPIIVEGIVSRTLPLHQTVPAYGRLLGRQTNTQAGTYFAQQTITISY